MKTKLSEADVIGRVDEVTWDTPQAEIENLLLIVAWRIRQQQDPPPSGYRSWEDVLVQIARNWNNQ